MIVKKRHNPLDCRLSLKTTREGKKEKLIGRSSFLKLINSKLIQVPRRQKNKFSDELWKLLSEYLTKNIYEYLVKEIVNHALRYQNNDFQQLSKLIKQMKSVKELKNVPDEKIQNDLVRIFQIISFENNSFKYLEEEETKENERTNCETKRSKYEEILTKTSRTSRKKQLLYGLNISINAEQYFLPVYEEEDEKDVSKKIERLNVESEAIPHILGMVSKLTKQQI